MPLSAGSLSSYSLTEVLRAIVEARPTGYLKLTEDDRAGCIGVENGVILNARAGSSTGLPALFQFVAWHHARFEFQELALAADASRELAAYDSHVLITGIAFKLDEQNLVLEAVPSVDAVVRASGATRMDSGEFTASDLHLLALADGRRTIKEIAQSARLGAPETARRFARLRLAGLLEVVERKASRPAIAA